MGEAHGTPLHFSIVRKPHLYNCTFGLSVIWVRGVRLRCEGNFAMLERAGCKSCATLNAVQTAPWRNEEHISQGKALSEREDAVLQALDMMRRYDVPTVYESR